MRLRPKAPSRRLGHRQSGNCRPQQRASKRKGKADVRHAHGPGSTALELSRAVRIGAGEGHRDKNKNKKSGCEAGGKGQRG